MEDVTQVKERIQNDLGIPQDLLKGETTEEVIANAKALLAFKRQHEQTTPKTTGEQFAQWVNDRYGEQERDEAGEALAQIAEEARINAGGYPQLRDGGSVLASGAQLPDGRPAAEQFAEWMGQRMAFDPRSANGWTGVV